MNANQVGINPLVFDEFVMRTDFDLAAAVHHDEAITIPQRREAMGNSKCGSTLTKALKRCLDLPFGLKIYGGGRLI